MGTITGNTPNMWSGDDDGDNEIRGQKTTQIMKMCKPNYNVHLIIINSESVTATSHL